MIRFFERLTAGKEILRQVLETLGEKTLLERQLEGLEILETIDPRAGNHTSRRTPQGSRS